MFRPGPRRIACKEPSRDETLTLRSIAACNRQPNAKGGVRAKPNPTRKSSRSPQPVRVKKEAGDDFGASSVQVVGGETLSDFTAGGDERQARNALASLRVKEGAGREGPSALGSRRVPKPYPVVYDGPVPRSIDDVDTPARLHQRRHCARLFDGTVKYDIDKDGLRECLLIELPELLPFDKERLLKWKASETQRIRDGKLSIEYDWDDRMTDEERKKVVECCSPADLEGMEAGRLRSTWRLMIR